MSLVLAKELAEKNDLAGEKLLRLIEGRDEQVDAYLKERARALCAQVYGKKVFIRGLIEFTNYCKNDCYYCGIRRSNAHVQRYRLTSEQILQCCREGYALGFRTFVLQGGEDAYFTDARMGELIAAIKRAHPDCAVTLSIGERSRQSYAALFRAGADRYLLRHETADCRHYAQLHPADCSFTNRMRALSDLREVGFQTGCGFMVGSPGQTPAHLVKDLRFIKAFRPHMVGIGPFLPQRDTPFGKQPGGSVDLTLFLLAVVRLMNPNVLLPATTALGTALADGREQGILSGANVVMPNLSPKETRAHYALYDGKLASGAEAAEHLASLKERLFQIGYEVVISRGDSLQR